MVSPQSSSSVSLVASTSVVAFTVISHRSGEILPNVR